MSEQIDWSKAPADATHYNTETEGWYKQGVDAYRWDGRKWYFVCADLGQIKFSDNLVERQTTTSWSSEGLPPVGVVCEVYHDDQWYETTIIGVDPDDGSRVFKTHPDYDTPYDGFVSASSFRPIRTPEQIAAEEREAAVNDMHAIYMKGAVHGGGLYAIYDAGYRKP